MLAVVMLHLLLGMHGLGGVLRGEAHALCSAAEVSAADPGCAVLVDPCVISRRLDVDDGCVLDFSGRDVTLANNGIVDIGGGTVTIQARNFTVATGGLIDGAPEGGMIRIHASGNLVIEPSAARGVLVTGDPFAGTVQLDAGGDVLVSGRIRASNLPNRPQGSGGSIAISAGGDILFGPASEVNASGGDAACGGSIDVSAAGSIEIEKAIDVAGRDGGTIAIDAGGDLVTSGPLLNHAVNGGSGGCVDVGADGNVTIGAAIENQGAGPLGSGCGGEVLVTSRAGEVIVRGDIDVRGGDAEGAGGIIQVSGRSVQIQSGTLIADGASRASDGGSICLDAAEDVVLDGRLSASGADFGGDIEVTGGRHVTVNGTVDVRSRSPGSSAGAVLIDAGRRGGGNLVVKAKVDASGPRCATDPCNNNGGCIDIAGCDVDIDVVPASPGTPVLDAAAPGPTGTGGSVFVTARRQLVQRGVVDANALKPGSVTLIHPSRRPPLLAVPMTVTPAPTIQSCDEASCTRGICAVVCAELCDCGNGSVEQFEECDGDASDCDGAAGQVCGVSGSVLACACIDTCGNGTIDTGEDCEQGLPGADCRSRGFASGSGRCRECAFDEATCDKGTCGDCIVAPRAGEVCEATDLAGRTCASLGFTRGVLRCASGCGSFDTTGCVKGFCGDGVIDPGEQCDAGAANADLPNAACRSNCSTPRCGDGLRDDVRGEQCDDGNARNDDGCLTDCIRATCGDGVVCSVPGCATGPGGGPEQCDESAICCLSTCGRRTCADGLQCGDRGGNGCCHPTEACDDGDPCTVDACNRLAGCSHQPIRGCCRVDTECDDANGCTDDGCDLGRNVCAFVPNAVACDDGNACTAADVCQGGACRGTAIVCPSPGLCLAPAGCDPVLGCRFTRIAGCCEVAADCADDNACTEERCDVATNRCVSTVVACSRPSVCLTPAGCDPVLGCRFTRIAGCCEAAADCVDANACTEERCDVGANRCILERRSGPEGLDCLVSQEVTTLQGTVDAQETTLGRKLAKQLRKLAIKGRKKIEKGRAKADKPPKAAAQLRKADTLFGNFGVKVKKARDAGKVDATVADDLLEQAETIRAIVIFAIDETLRQAHPSTGSG